MRGGGVLLKVVGDARAVLRKRKGAVAVAGCFPHLVGGRRVAREHGHVHADAVVVAVRKTEVDLVRRPAVACNSNSKRRMPGMKKKRASQHSSEHSGPQGRCSVLEGPGMHARAQHHEKKSDVKKHGHINPHTKG